MATGIPLPGQPGDVFNKGVDTGSSMFARMMQPIIQRENMQREWQQHLNQLGLQKEASGRAAELHPFHKMLLQAQVQEALAKANQENMWANLINPNSNTGMAENTDFNAMNGAGFAGNIPVPEIGSGKSFVEPLGNQSGNAMAALQKHLASQAPIPPQGAKQDPNLGGELIINSGNPQLYGFDKVAGLKGIPAVQTHYDDNGNMISRFPSGKITLTKLNDGKNAGQLDLFKKKEQIKQDMKAGDVATNKVLTQNQQSLQAIDTVIPMIDEFINNPKSVYGITDFDPAKKAAYNAKTGGMIDLLVAAQSLPQVRESVALVENQVRRQLGESTNDYIKRLKDFKKDLLTRKKKSVGVVKSKKVDTSVVTPEETKTLNGVKYEKINGEWHVAE